MCGAWVSPGNSSRRLGFAAFWNSFLTEAANRSPTLTMNSLPPFSCCVVIQTAYWRAGRGDDGYLQAQKQVTPQRTPYRPRFRRVMTLFPPLSIQIINCGEYIKRQRFPPLGALLLTQPKSQLRSLSVLFPRASTLVCQLSLLNTAP